MRGQKPSFGLSDFLNHIAEAIYRIEDYTKSLTFHRSSGGYSDCPQRFQLASSVGLPAAPKAAKTLT